MHGSRQRVAETNRLVTIGIVSESKQRAAHEVSQQISQCAAQLVTHFIGVSSKEDPVLSAFSVVCFSFCPALVP